MRIELAPTEAQLVIHSLQMSVEQYRRDIKTLEQGMSTITMRNLKDQFVKQIEETETLITKLVSIGS